MYIILHLQENYNPELLKGGDQLEDVQAELIWLFEEDRLVKTEANCQHELETGSECTAKSPIVHSKCTFRWAKTECLIIAGEMASVSSLLDSKFDIYAQMGRVCYQEEGVSKAVAGILVTYENCTQSIQDIYDFVVANC